MACHSLRKAIIACDVDVLTYDRETSFAVKERAPFRPDGEAEACREGAQEMRLEATCGGEEQTRNCEAGARPIRGEPTRIRLDSRDPEPGLEIVADLAT